MCVEQNRLPGISRSKRLSNTSTKGGHDINIFTSYKSRINTRAYNKEFAATTTIYRRAVDFFITVYLENTDTFSELTGTLMKRRKMETMTHRTTKNPEPKYPSFDTIFYKLPTYYRRAAIAAAIGKAESYLSNLKRWETESRHGKKPGYPHAGSVFPVLYRGGSFVPAGDYAFSIKVFVHNTWDWVTVSVRKGDADYILHHCADREMLVPSLTKHGNVWSLSFSFKETVELNNTPVEDQLVLAVDLGINSACTCCALTSDGTVVGREFLRLPAEEDSLTHAFNKAKKAKRNNAKRMPRMWARVDGINDRISVLTAQFIVSTAMSYGADVIVLEHLDLNGKKRGRGKQRLHFWRAQYVQSMVETKAHRLGIRIATVNAWGTSKFAFDGSGPVARGKDAGFQSYSLCRFASEKVYNCDLNASYNIGARYFIRELLKPCSETKRLDIEAKVPQCAKRSTCTLSTLIELNAVLTANAS